MRRLALATLALAAACTPAASPTVPVSDLRPSVAVAKSPLYVLYPHLDQRIVAFSLPQSGHQAQRIARYYPDLWNAEITAIRDFAVDQRRLYALASTRHDADASLLYLVDLKTGSVEKTVALSPSPQRLRWANTSRLLIGHAGPKGGVGIFDVNTAKEERFISLEGACIDLVSFGERVFLIERTERLIGANDVFATFQLVALDLRGGKPPRRHAIPAGARQVVIGPTGLLYISHVSGSGLHRTDATVSVYSPDDLARVDRLPFEMSARGMASNDTLLVSSLLKSNGDAWFNVTDQSHATVFDFRLSELVTKELVVIDAVAYIPLRQQNALERVDLAQKTRLPRLSLGAARHRDGSGLIRARVRTAQPKAAAETRQ